MVRLTLLTPAATDQEHIPTVLWSDPRVPDRTRARAGGPDPLPALLAGVYGLATAGCGAIAIPCNTAHGWFDEMQNATDRPILHIVDAAATELRRVAPRGVVGVMGTSATLSMRLYQTRLEALGWEVITPDADEMATHVTPAIAAVKANRVKDAYAPLAETVTNLAARGAVAVVLGCTEIPLGIQAGPWQELPVPLVDTIDALALAAIAWARPNRACFERPNKMRVRILSWLQEFVEITRPNL
jgi:aspartate racemase